MPLPFVLRMMKRMVQAALRRVLLLRADCLNAYVQRHFPVLGRMFRCEYVALHAWHPGAVELTAQEAAMVRRMQAGTVDGDEACAALRTRLPASFFEDGPVPVQRLVDRAATHFPALQNYRELARFLQQILARPPKIVVEIGTASGGMFFCLCQTAQQDGVVVSIDLSPARSLGPACSDIDREIFASFAGAAQRSHFIRGSSLSHSTLQALSDLLAGRSIDLLFIDGCHDYGAVKSDVERYSPLVAKDGVIALHDIAVFPHSHGAGMDVGIVWDELKVRHRVEEIIEPEGARSMAAWRERMQQFVRAHPLLSERQANVPLRDLLAQELGSDLVVATDLPRATPYQTVLDIPARYQMAWGIGVIDRRRS